MPPGRSWSPGLILRSGDARSRGILWAATAGAVAVAPVGAARVGWSRFRRNHHIHWVRSRPRLRAAAPRDNGATRLTGSMNAGSMSAALAPGGYTRADPQWRKYAASGLRARRRRWPYRRRNDGHCAFAARLG